MDLHRLIVNAKLGRARKDAQEDTCAVFAAALYDVLQENGVQCSMQTASYRWEGFSHPEWYHAVVEVQGLYYDSMGEFSLEICRNRLKLHPKVKCNLQYKPDSRDYCYDAEFDDLHAFYVGALRKAVKQIAPEAGLSIKTLVADQTA